MFNLSTERAKKLAKKLKSMLAEDNPGYKLVRAQDTLSRMLGHADWKALSAGSQGTLSIPDCEVSWAEVLRRRRQQVETVAAEGFGIHVAGLVAESLGPTRLGKSYPYKLAKGAAADLAEALNVAADLGDWTTVGLFAPRCLHALEPRGWQRLTWNLSKGAKDGQADCALVLANEMIRLQAPEEAFRALWDCWRHMPVVVFARADRDLSPGMVFEMLGDLIRGPAAKDIVKAMKDEECFDLDATDWLHGGKFRLGEMDGLYFYNQGVSQFGCPRCAFKMVEIYLDRGDRRRAGRYVSVVADGIDVDALGGLVELIVQGRLKRPQSEARLLQREIEGIEDAFEYAGYDLDDVLSWNRFRKSIPPISNAPEILAILDECGWVIEAPNPFVDRWGQCLGVAVAKDGKRLPIFALALDEVDLEDISQQSDWRILGWSPAKADGDAIFLSCDVDTGFQLGGDTPAAMVKLGALRLDSVYTTLFLQEGGLDRQLEIRRILDAGEKNKPSELMVDDALALLDRITPNAGLEAPSLPAEVVAAYNELLSMTGDGDTMH